MSKDFKNNIKYIIAMNVYKKKLCSEIARHYTVRVLNYYISFAIQIFYQQLYYNILNIILYPFYRKWNGWDI